MYMYITEHFTFYTELFAEQYNKNHRLLRYDDYTTLYALESI